MADIGLPARVRPGILAHLACRTCGSKCKEGICPAWHCHDLLEEIRAPNDLRVEMIREQARCIYHAWDVLMVFMTLDLIACRALFVHNTGGANTAIRPTDKPTDRQEIFVAADTRFTRGTGDDR